MPDFTATAPGKIILFGEHAVVYGQPALAVPVSKVRARVIVRPNLDPGKEGIQLFAPDIGLTARLRDLEEGHPLKLAVTGLLSELGVTSHPACSIHITSTLPIASGLGSSAAVTVALIRALSGFLGHPLPDDAVSELAFEVEKVHHGTPSGIDNTVITYAQPVYFSRGEPPQILPIEKTFTLVLGDTGIPSPTAKTVSQVREAYRDQPERFRDLFQAIGDLTDRARAAITTGNPEALGPLMDQNHQKLQEMGVSSSALDHLVEQARRAGALGAKLSGGGQGGNMIALVDRGKAPHVAGKLRDAGAKNTIITEVGTTGNQAG